MESTEELPPWPPYPSPHGYRDATPTEPPLSSPTIDPRLLLQSHVVATPGSSPTTSLERSSNRGLTCANQNSAAYCSFENVPTCFGQPSIDNDVQTNMASFLASFDFTSDLREHPDDQRCTRIDQIQSRLRTEFESKVSPSRARHISLIINISPQAQLVLRRQQSTENHGDTVAGLDRDDAALDTTPTDVTDDNATAAAAAVVVNASDTTTGQVKQSSTLQQLVSANLVEAIREIDGCSWSTKETTFDEDGWTFAYMCCGSWQYWKKKKNPLVKLAISEFSQKGPDAIASGRPAFDCKGSLTITFSRRNEVIQIKYTHTPFHKTVGELYDLLKPAPASVPVPVTAPAPGLSAENPTPGSSKKRRAPATEGETGKTPRKRKQASTKAVLPGSELGQIAHDANGDATTGIPLNIEPGLALLALEAQRVAEIEESARSALTVTLEEASKRRRTAKAVLGDAGVDPATLSEDQFHILANQSPELQRESLAMIVQYGAEKLRIVDPGTKERSTPTSRDDTPKQLSQQRRQSSKDTPKSRGGKSKDVPSNTKAQLETTASNGKKMGKSRFVCFNCKERKTKCSKERPTCSECLSANLTCEYPPVQPRQRKSKSHISEDIDDSNLEDAEGEEETMTWHNPAEPQDSWIAQSSLFSNSLAVAGNIHGQVPSNPNLGHHRPSDLMLAQGNVNGNVNVNDVSSSQQSPRQRPKNTDYQGAVLSADNQNTTVYPLPAENSNSTAHPYSNSQRSTGSMGAHSAPLYPRANNSDGNVYPHHRSQVSTSAVEGYSPQSQAAAGLYFAGGNQENAAMNSNRDVAQNITYQPYSYHKKNSASQSSSASHVSQQHQITPNMARTRMPQSNSTSDSIGRSSQGRASVNQTESTIESFLQLRNSYKNPIHGDFGGQVNQQASWHGLNNNNNSSSSNASSQGAKNPLRRGYQGNSNSKAVAPQNQWSGM